MIIAALRSIYTFNLGVKRHERVLVFTDTLSSAETVGEQEHCRRERLRDLALLTAEIGKVYAKKIMYLEFPATGSHGSEPPEELWHTAFGDKAINELRKSELLGALRNKTLAGDGLHKAAGIIAKHRKSAVDAVIALSNYSTSHTHFRNLLTGVCGSRYASMPLFDFAMIEGPMGTDWKALSKKTLSIAKMVNRAETVEVTTPNGSGLTVSKKGRKALSDTGILTKPGAFGNLPAGEVFFAPLEGKAQGVLVLEWAPTRQLNKAVTLLIKDGIVQEVSGDEPYAAVLKAKLVERPENRNIAEFGIGTNSMAKRPDNILESEKILGTIHVALGDNSSFGGKISTPFHQDFVFFRPTVTLEGKDNSRICLLEKGLLNFDLV
jgi:leucyl aminopeptidase (aminopeptidase T)